MVKISILASQLFCRILLITFALLPISLFHSVVSASVWFLFSQFWELAWELFTNPAGCRKEHGGPLMHVKCFRVPAVCCGLERAG